MSALLGAVLEFLGSGLGGPSSPRGHLFLFSAAGAAAVLATGGLFIISPDPLNEPSWGWQLLAGAILVGTGGIALSLWQLIRYRSEVLASIICLLVNAMAVLVPTTRLVN